MLAHDLWMLYEVEVRRAYVVEGAQSARRLEQFLAARLRYFRAWGAHTIGDVANLIVAWFSQFHQFVSAR